MLSFEAETDISKIWIDGNYYYFLWGNCFPIEVYDMMVAEKQPKGFYVIGPEEWEPVHLFSDKFSYEAFKYYVEAKGIDFKIISGSIDDPKYNVNYHLSGEKYFENHPTYFAHAIVDHALLNNIQPYGVKKNKIQKIFTSLNGRPHPWRCEFVDNMYAHGLFDHGYISWHELDHENDVYEYTWKYWSPKKMNFDINWKQTDGMKDLYLPPNEFKTSAISLISESNTECLFYTEKTFVPIFHQRPFVIYGAPYANRYLEKMGFKIFNEIIDYSFDEIQDDTERCQAYFKEVAKLKEVSYNDIVDSTALKVQHNFNRMLEIVENKEYIGKTWDAITKNNPHHQYLANYERILNVASTQEYKDWKYKYENSVNR